MQKAGNFDKSKGAFAIAALIAAIIPVVPGFLRAATTPGGQVPNPDVFDSLYVYSWFVTFAIGFVLYYVLMKLFPSHTEDGHLG